MVEGETLLPQRASVISSTRRTDTPSQVYFNKSLFYAALPAAIPLNNSSLEGDSFEFWHLESNFSGSRSEVAAVVAAAVALALLVTLVPGSLGQLLRLSLQAR